MKISNLPAKFVIPFGSNAGPGYIRNVPVNAVDVTQPGAASLETGFPPANFQPQESGGVPPFGQDFNGILKQMSDWNRWQATGVIPPYDASFQASIGGYPKYSLVSSPTINALFFLSIVDDNTTDPTSGASANWVVFSMADAGLMNVVTYATTGSFVYTPSDRTRAVIIEVQGAGAGGGGTNAPGAGGVSVGISGGAGAYARKYLPVIGWTTANIIVGAGGAGGAPTGNGVDGGASSFVCSISSITCGGGKKGNNNGTVSTFPSTTTTAGGGIATGGDVNIPGGNSQSALLLSASQGLVGVAGSSQFGTSNIQFATHSPGSSGLGRGSGGTGGIAYGGDGAVAGGNGADGLVIVTEIK